MRKALRQGDVLLVPVAQVQGERIKPVRRLHTVAEGEQTGHHHSVPASATAAAFLSSQGLFVRGQGDKLTHQEHDALSLQGDYEVVQQRRASDHMVMRALD